jgi:hypothetical protein
MFREHRRRGHLALAVATLVLVSGCTGVLVDRTASPAVVPDADHLAAGYEAAPVVAVPVGVPLAIGPVVREIRATGYLAVYTAPARNATVVVLSTPDEEVGGESANPLVHLTAPESVELALDAVRETGTLADVDVGDVGDLRSVGSEERTLLGTPTTVTTYAATATRENGSSVDLSVHVAAVRHDGDVILAIAVHETGSPEAPTALGLFERIDHPADVPVSDPPTRPESPFPASEA